MKKITLLISAVLLGIGVSQAQMSIVHNFMYDSYPENTVIQSGNVLYGITGSGGSKYYGNVFSVNTDGSNYKDLYDFQDTGTKAFHCSGEYPYEGLVLIGNTLFGCYEEGGLHGNGGIFSIHTDGTHFRDLWDMDDTGSISGNWGGDEPECTLVAIGHKLYGTSYDDGKYGYGNIFSIDTSYSLDSARKGYKDLWDFERNSDSNGAYPDWGGLTVSPNNKVLYGMTYDGGKGDDGNVYSIDTNGKHYKDLWDFDYTLSDDGYYPYSNQVLSGGKLYGTTYYGGGYGDGIVFSIDTNGHNYKHLLDFNYSTNGGYPETTPLIAGNMLYGMTAEGGAHNYGTLYSMDTVGNNYTDLFDFDYYTYGDYPYADLFLSSGVLYGMTEEGGGLDGGVLFGYDVCGTFKATSTSTIDGGSGNGTATANATGGPTPYTYLWTLSGQTTQTATGLVAGTYTVTVTNAAGCQTMSTVTVASATGVNNIANNAGINVYPNPNNGSFTIALSGTSDKSTVEVYNTMGQQVYTGALAVGNNTVNLNTKANGVYMYRIISDNGNLVGQGKLEVQK